MTRVICLNPVIDRVYFIDHFCAAEKFYEVEPRVYVGGKGINIARVMSLMGEPCRLYTFVGGGGGRLVTEEMRACGVEFQAFPIEGETRTTINIIDNQNRKETEITEPGVKAGMEEERRFLDCLEAELQNGDMVVCSGIPLKGMSEEIYRKVSGLCAKRGCRCVLDATGVYLKKSFPGTYFFSKPNFPELCQLFSLRGEETDGNMVEYGKRLLDMGVQNLLISTGERGGFFLNQEGVYRASIPKIQAVSTIGSGDSAVAGFCIGAARGFSPEESVRLAMACGMCNAGFSKVGYVEPEIVEGLVEEIRIERM